MLLFIESSTRDLRLKAALFRSKELAVTQAPAGGTPGAAQPWQKAAGAFPLGCGGSCLCSRRPRGLQPGMCRSKACTPPVGDAIWPYMLGMNTKNAFKYVLYSFAVLNRYIFTLHILAALWFFSQ